jgi:hypothetical protein
MTVDGIAGSLALALMSWIAGRAAFHMLLKDSPAGEPSFA